MLKSIGLERVGDDMATEQQIMNPCDKTIKESKQKQFTKL